MAAAPVETIEQIRSTVIDLALKFGPKLLAALIILAIGYLVGRQIARWLERALLHLEMEPPIRSLIVRIARIVISLLFVIMAMQNLGVELLPLVAGLGVAGAGIALAMQGLLGNLFAGLTIIFTKPFRVGEYIGIVGEEGSVETITLFQTTLSHPDRSRVVIPNRKIVGEILHNYGKIRQVDVTVGVAYDTDLNQALTLIQEVLRENKRVLHDVEPVIRVSQLAGSSINIAVRPWVSATDFGPASGDVNKSVLEAFREHGIEIPFPQREVRLLQDAA
ncbi:MAG TPA: mechanosensitive ion channel family protein [Steroidobacteraceae bacterium]|jgi:small conductance mechanosensitive channel|nr:mechanosensitive ion channel family protein [Steroidobacteraceae bacterium]